MQEQIVLQKKKNLENKKDGKKKLVFNFHA